MKKYAGILVLFCTWLFVSCSNNPKPAKAILAGNITVADSLDDTGDYSGISITIFESDTSGALDTLSSFTTDTLGNYRGEVEFKENRHYPLSISRNNRDLIRSSVILADNDTVNISGELPGKITINSREHRAMEDFIRVDKNYRRVAAYIAAGAVPDSQITDEIYKWSDTFWGVYEDRKGTYASTMAFRESIRLLEGLNDSLMMEKIDYALPEAYAVRLAMDYGKKYIAAQKGLASTIDYLDSLQSIIPEEDRMYEMLDREKIRLYFDSAEVNQARKLLTDYESKYDSDSETERWIETVRYDLTYLAPGIPAPDFSFETTEGDTVTKRSLAGTPYILEITPVASAEYRSDYDRTVVIHEIYKHYGLKIFTIPLDKSQVTANAFFNERGQHWSIADQSTFNIKDLIEKFNITQVPTRLLVDGNGIIVKKYVRGEFKDVIRGLNKIINNNTNTAS